MGKIRILVLLLLSEIQGVQHGSYAGVLRVFLRLLTLGQPSSISPHAPPPPSSPPTRPSPPPPPPPSTPRRATPTPSRRTPPTPPTPPSLWSREMGQVPPSTRPSQGRSSSTASPLAFWRAPWSLGSPPPPPPPPPPPCQPEAGDQCRCNAMSPVPAPDPASSGEKELSPLGSSGLHPSHPGVSVSGPSKASAATRVNATESSGIQGTGGSDSTVPNEFLCPITMEIMKDPVIAADGFTYERSAITQWLDSGTITSPMTNVPLPHANLLPNRTLKMLIQRHLEEDGQ